MIQATIIKDIYKEISTNHNTNSKVEKRPKNVISCFFSMVHYYYKLKRISKNNKFEEYLEKNNNICNGEYVLKGTRIKPIIVFDYWLTACKKEKNKSFKTIVKDIERNYPTINEKQITMSLLYCFKTMSFIKFFFTYNQSQN